MNEIGKVSLMFFKKDCMGCHACEVACPFGAMQFDDDQDLAFKCDLCYERHRNGQAPACSKTCPTGCIFWGDAKKLSEKIEKDVLKN